MKTMPRPKRPVAHRTARRGMVTTVHDPRTDGLEAMLALHACACAEGTLDEVLGGLVGRIAHLLGMDVCSIYLRDEGDELVLSATHGFPLEAVGNVRMRVGEGLTGFAVECLRPVSVAAATVDARNKRFASLPEENFPSLCALPLVDGGRAVGALVVQRAERRALDERELLLIAAMAPVVLLAIERARRRQTEAQPAGSGHTRHRVSALLVRGAGVSPGRAVGTIVHQRAPISHPESRAGDPATERVRLERAFSEATAEVAALEEWARRRMAEVLGSEEADRGTLGRAARSRLLALRFVIEDARLKQRALRHVAGGATADAAIERVAREYARVLGAATDEALQERAVELEAVCERLLLHRLDGTARAPDPARVLVGARLSVYEAIELARSHGAAAVLSTPAAESPGIEVARALGLPAVCDVRGLFRWAHDGDRALVDGEKGTILVNPPRAELAALRREKSGG